MATLSVNMGARTLQCLVISIAICACRAQLGDRQRNPFRSRDRSRSFDPYGGFRDPHIPMELISTTPAFTVLAPNLLRADSSENIYVEASRVTSPVAVKITILDFTKTTLLLQDSVELNQQNDFHSLKAVELPSNKLARDEERSQFVHLKVKFVGHHSEEHLLMVSFHSGYIFIQTDKPLYNPGDTVRCRALVSSPAFKAFDSSISVEFQNSEGLVIKKTSRTRATDGVYVDHLPLAELVTEGTWKITAKFDHWQQNTFTAEFEVKKYGGGRLHLGGRDGHLRWRDAGSHRSFIITYAVIGVLLPLGTILIGCMAWRKHKGKGSSPEHSDRGTCDLLNCRTTNTKAGDENTNASDENATSRENTNASDENATSSEQC